MIRHYRNQELSRGLTFFTRGGLAPIGAWKPLETIDFTDPGGRGLASIAPPLTVFAYASLYPLEYHAVHFISKQISMFWIEEK